MAKIENTDLKLTAEDLTQVKGGGEPVYKGDPIIWAVQRPSLGNGKVNFTESPTTR